jgi:sugar/nucleoside kinase (ribokinase family)
MTALRIPPGGLRYRAMIGVGGIGSGRFFALDGDETLGREESRGGRFLDQRDYCKLHIISHYVSRLLGRDFATIPVGKVGDDDVGERLLIEMAEAGLDLRYVTSEPDAPTLFSFCFVYPNGSGGNMTTNDSACSRVDAAYVLRAEHEFQRYEGCGVALAAPEVPIEGRTTLLRLGTAHGFFRVASFTSVELPGAIDSGLISHIDLLALNRHEAAVAAGLTSEGRQPEEIAAAAVERLRALNPAIALLITAGRDGSWTWDGEYLRHVLALRVPAKGTAGAGDAHLAGVLAGLAAGLPLAEAHHLGALVAAASVTSPHTIHPDLDADLLRTLPATLRESVDRLLR